MLRSSWKDAACPIGMYLLLKLLLSSIKSQVSSYHTKIIMPILKVLFRVY